MSRFMNKPSPAYAAAVEALLKLPLEERSRAFADATAPEMEREVDRRSRRVKTGTRSWRRLLGQRGYYDDVLPGDDHVELRLGANPAYVSHPYQLGLNEMRGIVETCDAHGLDCSVDARSWYFPGRTIRVEWREAFLAGCAHLAPRVSLPSGKREPAAGAQS